MNEILAIVVFAYFGERQGTSLDFTKMSDKEISENPDNLCAYIFDARHTIADVYDAYNCILTFGIKNLYLETKDITELRKEF
jgi:hypothetical protein